MRGVEEPRAKVFVITGPSGVGKGTLIRMLRDRVDELALSTSATTRAPRAGEEYGLDYHFLSREEFARRADANEFLEHAAYSGNRYGTLRSEVERRLAAGESVVLEIEVQGARQLNSYYRALGEGSYEEYTPPMVESATGNYLTIALQELAQGKIEYRYGV